MNYSKSFSEYRVNVSLDYEPRGYILFPDYRIGIDSSYERVFKKADLIAVREGKCCYPTEYRSEHRWAIEQLAAYYGKFMVILRRERQR